MIPAAARAVLLAVPVAGLAAGCAGGVPFASPAQGVARTFTAGGDRPVTVHLPAAADPAGAPLLLALLGYTASGSQLEGWLRLGPPADRRGVVWAFPDGSVNYDGERFWDATGATYPERADDAEYLAGPIDEIAAAVRVDRAREFVTGHSMGGFMSHRMACSYADKVAAIVSVSGATYVDREDCAASQPVAVAEAHGDADETVLFEGGSFGGPRYPSVAETMRNRLAIDGCDPDFVPTDRTVDVDASIDGLRGPADTVVDASAGCDAGGWVEQWTIRGGPHNPDFTDAFADAVLDFLLAHPKP